MSQRGDITRTAQAKGWTVDNSVPGITRLQRGADMVLLTWTGETLRTGRFATAAKPGSARTTTSPREVYRWMKGTR